MRGSVNWGCDYATGSQPAMLRLIRNAAAFGDACHSTQRAALATANRGRAAVCVFTGPLHIPVFSIRRGRVLPGFKKAVVLRVEVP